MSNYTYNKDNLKYLHHPVPVNQEQLKINKKFKKQLEKIRKEKEER